MSNQRELTMAEVTERSGFAASAVRYYEEEGLISSERTLGNQRRFHQDVLRRLAFIRAAGNVGLSINDIRDAFAELPDSRTPTKADWERIARRWQAYLDAQIEALQALRKGLTSCIGCGCLSLQRCAISNPQDIKAKEGPGARFLPARLRA